MKLLVILILALFCSVGVALLVKEDPGYVLVTVGQWTVETSVAVLLVFALVAFVLLYKLVRYSMRLADLPKNTRKANDQRRLHKAHRLLSTGMEQLAEGKWNSAEKTLIKSANYNDTPALSYIGAAKAAQHLGDDAKRDKLLKLATPQDGQVNVAVGLTQAELQMETGQLDRATQSLENLRLQSPKHPQVLKRLMECRLAAKDWQGLWRILPDLKKRSVLKGAEMTALETEVYHELLAEAAKSDTVETLQKAWKDTPVALRRDVDMVVDYAGYLEGHGAVDRAEQLIRKALDQNWDPKIVLAYGEINRANAETQLKFAEAWLQSHPKDPDLLLTLGRIARRNHQWQKARQYYEQSIALRPAPDAYQELGSLLDQLEEPQKARDSYRNGMRLLTGKELASTSNVLDAAKPETTDKLERKPAPADGATQAS